MNSYNKKYQIIETYGLMIIDLLCTSIAYYLAYIFRFKMPGKYTMEGSWIQVYFVCAFVCLLYDLATDAYHHFFRRGYYEEAIQVLKYDLFMFIVVSAGLYIFRMELEFSRLLLGYFVVLQALLTYVVRVIFKNYMKAYYSRSRNSDKVLVITTSEELDSVMKHIAMDAAWSYEVVGIALLDQDRVGEMSGNIPIVANNDNVIDVARQSTLDVVFLHCSEVDVKKLELLIQSFLAMGILCHDCVERVNVEAPHCHAGKFAGFPVMTYTMTVIDYRRRVIKRLMDIVGGLIGLFLTAVMTPAVAIAIKLDSKGPVFFSQTRIGKNGRRFKMYKFRSMYMDAEERKKELMQHNEMRGLMFKMVKDPRITRVGVFLRKTSIDELPQFWNVIKGDMSLLGTRPPTVEEFEQYNVYYRRRLSITPGLTGMWQVSGRSDITDFDEVVRLDLQYIDEWSLRKDLKILIQTVGVVLFRRGSR